MSGVDFIRLLKMSGFAQLVLKTIDISDKALHWESALMPQLKSK